MMCNEHVSSFLISQRPIRRQLFLSAKSRMPIFSEEDEEALRLMTNEAWNDWEQEDVPDFSKDNKPRKPKPAPAQQQQQQQQQQQRQRQQQINEVQQRQQTNNIPSPRSSSVGATPNANWRTSSALTTPRSAPSYNSPSSSSSSSSFSSSSSSSTSFTEYRAPIFTEQEDFEFTDLDYDDFQLAMMEEEGFGLGPTDGGMRSWKQEELPPEHVGGIKAGEKIPLDVWASLVDSEGVASKFSKIHKDQASVVVAYADPRRMNDEFREILGEIQRIPLGNLHIAAALINADEPNDHRKFLKKNALSVTLLSDKSNKFTTYIKCRGDRRLLSALFLIDVKSQTLLKIWYQGEFDSFIVKDTVVAEMKKYRACKSMAEYFKLL